jgi:hypothetical protein
VFIIVSSDQSSPLCELLCALSMELYPLTILSHCECDNACSS